MWMYINTDRVLAFMLPKPNQQWGVSENNNNNNNKKTGCEQH